MAWRHFNVRVRSGSSRLILAGGESRSEAPLGHFVVWLITAGRGSVSLLGRTIRVRRNATVLIPSGTQAQLQFDGVRRGELVRVSLDCLWHGEPVHDARPYVDPERLTFTLPGHVTLSLHVVADATLPSAMTLLRAAARQPADLGDLEASIQMLRLFACLRLAMFDADRNIPRHTSQVRRGYVYLLTHRSEPGLSLAGIARAVNMSVTHFSRLFRAEFGTSPMRVLALERMSYARRLLQSPDLQVTETAKACGYGSLEHFCRVFKAEHGVTPGEYRAGWMALASLKRGEPGESGGGGERFRHSMTWRLR